MTFCAAAPLARTGLMAAGLALATALGLAQKPTKYEVATLYTYLRTEAPPRSALPSESPEEKTFHGSKTELSVFPSKHFGLTAAVASARGSNSDLLGGPEFVLLDKGRVSVRLNSRVGSVIRQYEPTFSTTAGSSVDVYLGKNVALRLQPEMLWWRRDGTHTDFRISAGVVARFGKTR